MLRRRLGKIQMHHVTVCLSAAPRSVGGTHDAVNRCGGTTQDGDGGRWALTLRVRSTHSRGRVFEDSARDVCVTLSRLITYIL